jgi:hypothetical protein
MLRFLLIFFGLATLLLSILMLRSGKMMASFFNDPQPVPASTMEKMEAAPPNDRVRFSITPQPVQAMKPLLFQVILQNDEAPQSIMVDLSMPKMFMGLNQVTLKKSTPGIYEGVGILPTCPSGRKLWQASVIIDQQAAGNFFFNVQY